MKKIYVLLVIILTTGVSIFSQTKTPQLLNVPGAIFRYTIEGSGPYVVAFTGSENLGHSMYSDRLRKHITFIYADPQLIPQSVMNTLTMDSIIQDIDRVRKFLKVKNISVMGHSMFGILPMEYALKYPDRIKFSISTGAMPYTTSRATDLSKTYWDSSATAERKAIREENLKQIMNEKVEKSGAERFWDSYKANVPLRFADPHFDISSMMKAGINSTNMSFIGRFWGVILKDYDNSANYQEILTPVLVIAGKYDFGAPYFLWKDFGKKMPDYTFYLFEDAGHNPMVEVPDKFDQVLIDWISAHK